MHPTRYPLSRILALATFALGTLLLTASCGGPALETDEPGAVASDDQAATSTAVFLIAGDIATDDSNHYLTYTSNLLDKLVSANPGARVGAAGDLVYMGGQYSENYYVSRYHPKWGRHKSITFPALGNHDYYNNSGVVTKPDNYFNYWGSAAGPVRYGGWNSWNHGAWHIITLNSMCGENSGTACDMNQQLAWLENDLNNNAGKKCVLAFWHHPIYGSSSSNTYNWGAAEKNAKLLFQKLYDHNADVIVTGHAHYYERLAPMNPSGSLDTSRGIRQFVVGTGGQAGSRPSGTAPRSEVIKGNVAGILELDLKDTSFTWKYHSALSWVTWTDTGTGSCH